MALLHLVRDRGRRLTSRRSARLSGFRLRAASALLVSTALVSGCRQAQENELAPDEVLQAELGLSPDDRVHRVTVTGGPHESASPPETVLEPGAWVEFVTGDGFIHEVIFEMDSLSVTQRAFLERSDQVASPPLVDRGSRYVLSFVEAPIGRYPFRLEGNAEPGRGTLVVRTPEPR